MHTGATGKVRFVNIDDTDPGPGWLRWGLRAVTLLLAVLVIALTAVLAVGDEDEQEPTLPRAEAGDVLRQIGQAEPPRVMTDAWLPWARVRIGASEPVDALPNVRMDATPVVRAPEGGSFVRVLLLVEARYPFTTVGSTEKPAVELVLRADGKEYPVMDSDSWGFSPRPTLTGHGDRWVAVDGHPVELELLLTVDGETQVIDAVAGTIDAGRAAALADLPSQRDAIDFKDTECTRFRAAPGAPLRIPYPRYARCSLSYAARTPYVVGLGWSEPGREFLVAQFRMPFDIRVASTGAHGSGSWRTSYDVRARLKGDDTAVAGSTPGVPGSTYQRNGVQFVFDVAADEPTGDLTVLVDLTAWDGNSVADAPVTVTFSTTMPGRKLP